MKNEIIRTADSGEMKMNPGDAPSVGTRINREMNKMNGRVDACMACGQDKQKR